MNLSSLARLIDDYSAILTIMENFFIDLTPRPPADMVLNYRDALCHYVKCYEAHKKLDTDTFLKQEACIQEHLDRGFKDGVIRLSYLHCRIITMMLEDLFLLNHHRSNLKLSLHSFQNLSMDVREQGISITRILTNEQKEMKELKDIKTLIHNFTILRESDKLLEKSYANARDELKKGK